MLKFKNGGRLVQSSSELPDLRNAKELYADFETTSFEPATKALDPWKGHRIAGICVTADDAPGAWYIPIRHNNSKWNIEVEAGLRWLKDIIESCDDWVNHNVKFDAHFAAADDVWFQGRLIDTLTLAKIIDSDRLFKGGYGLDALSHAWLDKDINEFEDAVKNYLAGVKLHRNKKAYDYGLVPADIMGEYGCQDVLTNRDLYAHMLRVRPAEVHRVWKTEIKLTPVLFDMEQYGMRVEPLELKKQDLMISHELLLIEESLHSRLDFDVNPDSNDSCFELLCNHWGLPVLTWNDSGNPSFDKAALTAYLNHPDVTNDEERTQVVDTLLHYRKRSTLLKTFVRAYRKHEQDGLMHPDYDQAKRTGRMGCRRPNAQQLSPDAKKLILPGDGRAFLSMDYSQIEFRLIVHYLRTVDAIKSYRENPDTDFHQWVADMCQIPRKPAKNVNFAIGFGAGKRKVTSMLASDMAIVGKLGDEVQKKIDSGAVPETQRKIVFDALCQNRAEEVFESYHNMLGSLRDVSKKAARKVRARGYVFNAYGRRRHLPDKVAHIAFNSIIQSCAADVMKERAVAIAPRYNEMTRALDCHLIGLIHDEFLFNVPQNLDKFETARKFAEILEKPSVEFRVPIRVSAGWSDETWAIAGSDEAAFEIPRLSVSSTA